MEINNIGGGGGESGGSSKVRDSGIQPENEELKEAMS